MQSINHWRNWTPERQRKIEDCAEVEPTKPTKPDSVSFVSSIPYQVPIISSASTGLAEEDPACWQEDFTRWMHECCTHREGFEDWGGVGGLLVDFAEWQVRHNSVPCDRRTFGALVRSAGWPIDHYGLVPGLILKVDLGAIRTSRPTTHPNK
jgi:hypothetical protein